MAIYMLVIGSSGNCCSLACFDWCGVKNVYAEPQVGDSIRKVRVVSKWSFHMNLWPVLAKVICVCDDFDLIWEEISAKMMKNIVIPSVSSAERSHPMPDAPARPVLPTRCT